MKNFYHILLVVVLLIGICIEFFKKDIKALLNEPKTEPPSRIVSGRYAIHFHNGDIFEVDSSVVVDSTEGVWLWNETDSIEHTIISP